MRSPTGGSRVRSSVSSQIPRTSEADSSHNSTVGGGDSVHLELLANQIPQPRVIEEEKLTCENNVVVQADWEFEEFAWVSEFLEELPDHYLNLLKQLRVREDDYFFENWGFYCWKHVEGKTRKCAIKKIYLPVIRCGKYHPYTSVKHKRRAGRRALERLEFLQRECEKRRVKFDYLIGIDLTLPKTVSREWNNGEIQRRIHQAVRDFLTELHGELFPNKNSQFGAISNHHYWATKKPLTPHRHIHLTIPNVTYNKTTGMFHRFKPHIEADLVRELWKKCLVKNGLWFGVPGYYEVDVYVRYFKFGDRGKAIHRLTYCSRKPIEDFIREGRQADLSDYDEEFALFLLDYTPRIINLGFLTNLKRFGYTPKPNCVKCPICGGDMVVECKSNGIGKLYDRPPPEVPYLFQKRNGIWMEIPRSVESS